MSSEQREDLDHDEGLPFFTVDEADHFRSLVRTEVAKYGKELTFHADHMTSSDGGVFGFWNVGQDCRRNPRWLWPKIVATHFEGLKIDPAADFFQGLSEAQVRRNVCLRIWPVQSLPFPETCPYARTLAPGLLEVIAFQRKRAVMAMRQEDVDRFGGLESLREAAMGNLRILPIEHRELVEHPSGGNFRVASGSSSFVASLLLVADRLVSQLFVDPAMPHGVLAAIPNRHEVAVHVIRDETAVESTIGLAIFASKGYSSQPGPISPHVYWVTPDRFEEVLRIGPGGPEFPGSPQFKAMMDRIVQGEREGTKAPPRPAPVASLGRSSWKVGCTQPRRVRRGRSA
jgi:hypothetical protein